MASHPKPNPRAGAGSSSATIVHTRAVSAPRNSRATNWQAAKLPIVGARAVAAVAMV